MWEAQTGLKCDSWQTKYMVTKWGACSTEKKKLWFNLQLAQKPYACLPERHPVLTNVLKAVGIAAVAAGAEAIANSGKGSGGSSRLSSSDDYFSDPSSDDEYADSLGVDDDDDSPSEREYPDERSSPEEHTVRRHDQHYHSKDGVIWKEKEPYQRGGKHGDD